LRVVAVQAGEGERKEGACRADIGRATLYKYFADVEAILVAWHERHVQAHLTELAALGERPGTPAERLEAVLEAYAQIVHVRDHSHLASVLHRQEHAAAAEHRLHAFVRDLVVEGAKAGAIRADVAADELSSYCIHALGAARDLPSKAAVRRLVTLTLAALQPQGTA
jgi:AcrR family transcriptional regulator